jgi:hypothetical protein
MAFSHPSTTLFSAVSLATGGSQTSPALDATAGAGALIEIKVSTAGAPAGTITVQAQHSPDGTATYYPWGNPIYPVGSATVPTSSVPIYFDWVTPPEGGKWQFVVQGSALTTAACTIDGRATVLTPG